MKGVCKDEYNATVIECTSYVLILYSGTIKLILREGHCATGKYMTIQWPIYTFAALV
jgi:hypothetical protein